MQFIHAKAALTIDGWVSDVRIGVNLGRISSLESGSSPEPDDVRANVLIPGMPNVHSHAFQRGMAGLAEVRGPSPDSFWTWREIMYRFALSMSPPQFEVIASQAYMEMLEAGFTRVGEFHYLHHDRDGAPYANIAEMATRVAAAASETGIFLTLLPTFYAHSGFGGLPPGDHQRRFITDVDTFARLVEQSKAEMRTLDGAVLGIAPHSLRAVTPDELNLLQQILPTGPIHIHAAEQQLEVDDCLAWSGMRPVEWLLDHVDLSDRWCLIHATHMTADETKRLAESRSVAGLCPVTEANLGDGSFPGATYAEHGGQFGIGTDSNVSIGVNDELRQLEYAQRLAHRARNVLAKAGGSTGSSLFDAARRGGSAALGATNDGISIGQPADLVNLESNVLPLGGGDTWLDVWIFANGVRVADVWVAGRRVVREGRHIRHDEISRVFRQMIDELVNGKE